MTTEEEVVLTEQAHESKDEISEISAKVAESLNISAETDSDLAKKGEKITDDVKGEEAEDDFETPEEGDGEEAAEEAKLDPEEGDGEEAAEEAKLDDDQDIQNPAYIPKTGKYYMHDSREDTDAPREEKKSRADGMWSRDRFDERYQQPRSRKQMIEKYGFDIRLGETKELAEEKEKEMVAAGVDLETEIVEKVVRRDFYKERDGMTEKARGQRRQPQRRDVQSTKSAENEEDDIRPAARRDTRNERSSYSRGEDAIKRVGNGGRREATFNRIDKGRGGQNRQFNRTFNNSARNSGRDENKDRDAPKRYSAQRGEKNAITSVIDHPTDIVYFDPTKQTPRENQSLIREKKPLDIVPPPS